jgi:hypothetical protein
MLYLEFDRLLWKLPWWTEETYEVLRVFKCQRDVLSVLAIWDCVFQFLFGLRLHAQFAAVSLYSITWAGVPYSIWRVALGWAVRGFNSGGRKIFCTLQTLLDRPLAPAKPSVKCTPRVKRRGVVLVTHPPPHLSSLQLKNTTVSLLPLSASWHIRGRPLPYFQYQHCPD